MYVKLRSSLQDMSKSRTYRCSVAPTRIYGVLIKQHCTTRTLCIEGSFCQLSEVCTTGIVETCRNFVKKVATLPTCIKGDHARDSAVTSSEKEIGEEGLITIAEIFEFRTSPASVAAASSSQAVTSSHNQRLKLLRSQICGSEIEYGMKLRNLLSIGQRCLASLLSIVVYPVEMANRKRFKRFTKQWCSPMSEYCCFSGLWRPVEDGSADCRGRASQNL